MRAILCDTYGPPEVLHLAEVPTPTPGPRAVRVKIHATTVSTGDVRVRGLSLPAGFAPVGRLMLGFRGPRQPILGTECSGVIDAVGAEVTRWRVGDAVFGMAGHAMGCHAEYRCFPEEGALAPIPPGLDFSAAAALCFGGTTALDFLRRAQVRPGERVLVNGASGCVGVAAVQLARHMGAEVTGVCSEARAELVRSLGAEHIIDYRQKDFAHEGETWDVIVDTVGNAPFSRVRRVLRENGRLLAVLAGLPELLKAPWQTATSPMRVIAGPASERPEDVRTLGQLAQSGACRAVIERSFPFARMAEAHRFVETGRKVGSVVVTVD